jgi:hypothetical protein
LARFGPGVASFHDGNWLVPVQRIAKFQRH